MSAGECLDQARDITEQSNSSLAGSGRLVIIALVSAITFSSFLSEVKDDAIKELISRLTGLLLQIEVVVYGFFGLVVMLCHCLMIIDGVPARSHSRSLSSSVIYCSDPVSSQS